MRKHDYLLPATDYLGLTEVHFIFHLGVPGEACQIGAGPSIGCPVRVLWMYCGLYRNIAVMAQGNRAAGTKTSVTPAKAGAQRPLRAGTATATDEVRRRIDACVGMTN